jgi:putative ABC transport system permease protein
MLLLAVRNLFQSRVRLVVSVGGVALALLLLLALDAVVAGMQQQLTAYIEHTGADVWVAQDGVRTMHMSASAMPLSKRSQVRAVPEVASVTPILYAGGMVVVGDHRHLAYIIGLTRESEVGRSWGVVDGSNVPREGEAVIDATVADAAGVGLGDTVEIFGEELIVAGLAEGTANLVNSIAFISRADFARLRGGDQNASFLLVTTVPGAVPETVAARIEATVEDVTAQSRTAFAAQERQIVTDMTTDVLAIMNTVGVLIGLAVVALTVYTATLSRRAEYGVLKALGAGNAQLAGVVVLQAAISVALGMLVATLLTLLLTFVAPQLSPTLVLQMSAAALIKAGGAALGIAGVAALLPVRQIAGLDPAQVFRGGVR